VSLSLDRLGDLTLTLTPTLTLTLTLTRTLPFTLRAGKDERAWRMGVVECKNHGMFVEYPVLFEKL